MRLASFEEYERLTGCKPGEWDLRRGMAGTWVEYVCQCDNGTFDEEAFKEAVEECLALNIIPPGSFDPWKKYRETYLVGHCHPTQEGTMKKMSVAPGAKCIYAGCHGIIQRTEVFPVDGTQIAGQEYLCTCGARWVNWLSPTSTKLLTKRDFVPGLQPEFRALGRPLKTDEAMTKQQVQDKIDALEKELSQLRARR